MNLPGQSKANSVLDSGTSSKVPALRAYLITLKSPDSASIKAACGRLTAHGFEVVIIQGVNGSEIHARDYFRLTNFWHARTGHLMTPGELGCALSHKRAWQMAASHGEGQHLILEDDFIVSDAALKWIADIHRQVGDGTLLHLGGQEGLKRFYRYVRAVPLQGASGIAVVEPKDLEFLARAVAYIVDSKTAAALCELMERAPYVVDNFAYALTQKAVKQIWFRWVVSHPVDLSASAIEDERRLMGITMKRHWSYRSRMNWARLWRHLVSPPSAFLKNRQPGNQLPN
jgi:glycosyl transferase family 25